MDLIAAVSLISFSLSAFLAGLLFFDRERRPATPLLAALLAIHALAFLLRYGFTTQSLLIVYLPFIVFPLLTVHGPLVELFVRRSLFEEDRSQRKMLPLGAAPLAVLVVHGLLFATIDDFRSRDAILDQTAPIALYSRLIALVFSAYNVIFLVRAWRALRGYRARFQESFSNLDDLRLEFLRAFLGLTTLVYLSFPGTALVSFFMHWSVPITPLEGLLLLGLTYLVLYYLVRRPQIFTLPTEEPTNGAARMPAEASKPASPETSPSESSPVKKAAAVDADPRPAVGPGQAQKYARQSLDTETRRSHLRRIRDFMEAEEPYLNGELALADLAEAVEIPKHHVSMVINIELERNFFQFVNSYRVDAARRLLSDPGQADETLLNIAYRAGFQSKAAFNRVFKQVTGQTPGQFRKAGSEASG
ncbi:MAG: AraC family transcriptional regulator [Acidobacteriota bacterium]